MNASEVEDNMRRFLLGMCLSLIVVRVYRLRF
jgi:hypothetical protein